MFKSHEEAQKALGMSVVEYNKQYNLCTILYDSGYPLNKCNNCEEIYQDHPDAYEPELCGICAEEKKIENRDAYGLESPDEPYIEEDEEVGTYIKGNECKATITTSCIL